MNLLLVLLFSLTPHEQLTRDIYEQLVEIDTSKTTTRAARAMEKRFLAAGFPRKDVKVLGPHKDKQNLVVRLRGSGKKRPLLLLAHLDVVEARRSDWSVDPYTLLEQDGWFYGRGSSDDKAMAAMWVATLIRLKKENARLDRDLIVALTADEEGGNHNGVAWLLKEHRPLIDAEFSINEGGSGLMKQGKYLANEVQASEKVYVSYRLEVTNPGGHSSMPVKDNAIYRLAAGLTRLAAHEFPVELGEVQRGYFLKMSALESGHVAVDMKKLATSPAGKPDAGAAARLAKTNAYYNAQMRTTCVATQLEGGHAENALPQTARAVVNCRVLPGVDPKSVEATLVRVLDDPGIKMTSIWDAEPSPPSPLTPEVMGAIEAVTAELFPGIPVVPSMSTGATDSRYLRNAGIPTYGVSGIFADVDDSREHGKDERIGVKQFYEGNEFLYRLVKRLAAAPAS